MFFNRNSSKSIAQTYKPRMGDVVVINSGVIGDVVEGQVLITEIESDTQFVGYFYREIGGFWWPEANAFTSADVEEVAIESDSTRMEIVSELRRSQGYFDIISQSA